MIHCVIYACSLPVQTTKAILISVRNQGQRIFAAPQIGRELGTNNCESNASAIRLMGRAINGLLNSTSVTPRLGFKTGGKCHVELKFSKLI